MGDRSLYQLVEFIVGNGEHAEMKIKQRLREKGKLDNGNTYPIGIAKLACCPCSVSVGLSSNLEITGTHGGTYPGWRPPECDLEDDRLLEGLRKISETGAKYDKIREVPNLTPEDLRMRQPLLARKTPEELEARKKELESKLSLLRQNQEKLSLLNNELKNLKSQETKLSAMITPGVAALKKISELGESKSALEKQLTRLTQAKTKLIQEQQQAKAVKGKKESSGRKDKQQRELSENASEIIKLNEQLEGINEKLDDCEPVDQALLRKYQEEIEENTSKQKKITINMALLRNEWVEEKYGAKD